MFRCREQEASHLDELGLVCRTLRRCRRVLRVWRLHPRLELGGSGVGQVQFGLWAFGPKNGILAQNPNCTWAFWPKTYGPNFLMGEVGAWGVRFRVWSCGFDGI